MTNILTDPYRKSFVSTRYENGYFDGTITCGNIFATTASFGNLFANTASFNNLFATSITFENVVNITTRNLMATNATLTNLNSTNFWLTGDVNSAVLYVDPDTEYISSSSNLLFDPGSVPPQLTLNGTFRPTDIQNSSYINLSPQSLLPLSMTGTIWTNGNQLFLDNQIIGQTGPTGFGPPGPSGPTGPTGFSFTGPTGPTGFSYTGPTGPTGFGSTGPTGFSLSPTGPTGPSVMGSTGPTGSFSISTLTSGAPITISNSSTLSLGLNYNSTNLQLTSSALNTIQNINTTANVNFNSATFASNLGIQTSTIQTTTGGLTVQANGTQNLTLGTSAGTIILNYYIDAVDNTKIKFDLTGMTNNVVTTFLPSSTVNRTITFPDVTDTVMMNTNSVANVTGKTFTGSTNNWQASTIQPAYGGTGLSAATDWYAYVGSGGSNLTGDGTTLNLGPLYNSTLFNNNSAWNTTTGTLTCPSGGYYSMTIQCRMIGLTASHTAGRMWVIINAATTNLQFFLIENSPAAELFAGGDLIYQATFNYRFNTNDTLNFYLQISNGSKVVGIQNTSAWSWFSGKCIGN